MTTTAAPPRSIEDQPARSNRGAIARLIALVAVLFGPQLFLPAAAFGVMWIAVLVAFVWFAPQLGIRRLATPLVILPIISVAMVPLILWRVASLPDRYWKGSMWPARWTWLSVAGVAIVLAFVPFGLRSFALDNGWHDSAEKAVAAQLRDGHIARRDNTPLGLLVTGYGSSGQYETFRVRSHRALFGRDWEVDPDFGPYWLNTINRRLVAIRVPSRAVTVELQFYQGPSVTVEAVNGVAYVFPDKPLGNFTGSVAFDKNGRVLPRVAARSPFTHR